MLRMTVLKLSCMRIIAENINVNDHLLWLTEIWISKGPIEIKMMWKMTAHQAAFILTINIDWVWTIFSPLMFETNIQIKVKDMWLLKRKMGS